MLVLLVFSSTWVAASETQPIFGVANWMKIELATSGDLSRIPCLDVPVNLKPREMEGKDLMTECGDDILPI